jgi:hypothetical protein
MAGYNLALSTGEVSLVAATAKTVGVLLAAAQHRVRVQGLSMYFKDTVVTDTPVKVELVRVTTGGTAGSSPTPVKKDENAGETIQTTANINYSAEPTITDILETKEIHPQTGEKMYYPFGQEVYIKGGNKFGVRMTSAQNQTVALNFELEE